MKILDKANSYQTKKSGALFGTDKEKATVTLDQTTRGIPPMESRELSSKEIAALEHPLFRKRPTATPTPDPWEQVAAVEREITPPLIAEAIRLGCAAADVHLTCGFPDCTCTKIPRAVKASVAFVLRNSAHAMAADIGRDIVKAISDGR